MQRISSRGPNLALDWFFDERYLVRLSISFVNVNDDILGCLI